MSCCGICGKPTDQDLYSYVTMEKVCSLCKIQFIGGLPTTDEKIQKVRKSLKLNEGEYLKRK